mmetsp:Transcript_11349/g.30251  ORF Transcript_11349/g.30251 Transcript_11349/m.30251 type:complete len:218 (-) Transcript_11349:370-1023(-)
MSPISTRGTRRGLALFQLATRPSLTDITTSRSRSSLRCTSMPRPPVPYPSSPSGRSTCHSHAAVLSCTLPSSGSRSQGGARPWTLGTSTSGLGMSLRCSVSAWLDASSQKASCGTPHLGPDRSVRSFWQGGRLGRLSRGTTGMSEIRFADLVGGGSSQRGSSSPARGWGTTQPITGPAMRPVLRLRGVGIISGGSSVRKQLPSLRNVSTTAGEPRSV